MFSKEYFGTIFKTVKSLLTGSKKINYVPIRSDLTTTKIIRIYT